MFCYAILTADVTLVVLIAGLITTFLKNGIFVLTVVTYVVSIHCRVCVIAVCLRASVVTLVVEIFVYTSTEVLSTSAVTIVILNVYVFTLADYCLTVVTLVVYFFALFVCCEIII